MSFFRKALSQAVWQVQSNLDLDLKEPTETDEVHSVTVPHASLKLRVFVSSIFHWKLCLTMFSVLSKGMDRDSAQKQVIRCLEEKCYHSHSSTMSIRHLLQIVEHFEKLPHESFLVPPFYYSFLFFNFQTLIYIASLFLFYFWSVFSTSLKRYFSTLALSFGTSSLLILYTIT